MTDNVCKDKEGADAEDWTFYLQSALAGIVAEILYGRGKKVCGRTGAGFLQEPGLQLPGFMTIEWLHP